MIKYNIVTYTGNIIPAWMSFKMPPMSSSISICGKCLYSSKVFLIQTHFIDQHIDRCAKCYDDIRRRFVWRMMMYCAARKYFAQELDIDITNYIIHLLVELTNEIT